MNENLSAVIEVAIVIFIFIFTSAAIFKALFLVFDRYKKIRRLHKIKSLKSKTYSAVCPFCRIELEIPPKANGQKVQCPECGNKFITRKHSLNKFKLDSEKVKWFFSTIREYQILLAGILLSMAIIIYAIINYNTDRYYLHKESQRVPFILDKNAGKLYSPASSIKEYNWNLCDPIKKARK